MTVLSLLLVTGAAACGSPNFKSPPRTEGAQVVNLQGQHDAYRLEIKDGCYSVMKYQNTWGAEGWYVVAAGCE